MSEVGFEPGTFRSCVEHSNHYATETPPIPDVLLVLVAPKYINRNVTTTLQSRFTPTPTPQATHSSFFILLLLLLFYFILFFFFFFFYLFFFFFIFLFFFFLFFLFYFFFFFFIFFIFFYFIFFSFILLNTSHSSPPPSSLSPPQPALFADHFRFRSLPVSITSGFDHFRFPPRTLRRPLPDLGVNVSDNIRCDVINPYLLT